MFIPEFQIGFK